nr:MAG TPA: hypothetical protein [Caudoviricetes sp.]
MTENQIVLKNLYNFYSHHQSLELNNCHLNQSNQHQLLFYLNHH